MSSGRIISSASTWPFTKSVIGVSTKPGQSAVTWIPASPSSTLSRLREADHARLRRRIDGEPPLARLARNRSRIDDQRLPMLPARLAKHPQALARRDHDRPEIEIELHVDLLRRIPLDRPAQANAGVVHQHIHPAPALAMLVDRAHDVFFLGHLRRHGMHVDPGRAQVSPPPPPACPGAAPQTVTPYPSSPSARAIANPMPLEPPVTSAARSATSAPLVALTPRGTRGRRTLSTRAHQSA